MVFLCPVTGFPQVTVTTWCHCTQSWLPDLPYPLSKSSVSTAAFWSFSRKHLWFVANTHKCRILEGLARCASFCVQPEERVYAHSCFVMWLSRGRTSLNLFPDLMSLRFRDLEWLQQTLKESLLNQSFIFEKTNFWKEIPISFLIICCSPCVCLSLKFRVLIFSSVISLIPTDDLLWNYNSRRVNLGELKILRQSPVAVTTQVLSTKVKNMFAWSQRYCLYI